MSNPIVPRLDMISGRQMRSQIRYFISYLAEIIYLVRCKDPLNAAYSKHSGDFGCRCEISVNTLLVAIY